MNKERPKPGNADSIVSGRLCPWAWCGFPMATRKRCATWCGPREDMKAIEHKARQRLGAFLLRLDRIYQG